MIIIERCNICQHLFLCFWSSTVPRDATHIKSKQIRSKIKNFKKSLSNPNSALNIFITTSITTELPLITGLLILISSSFFFWSKLQQDFRHRLRNSHAGYVHTRKLNSVRAWTQVLAHSHYYMSSIAPQMARDLDQPLLPQTVPGLCSGISMIQTLFPISSLKTAALFWRQKVNSMDMTKLCQLASGQLWH